MPKFKVTYAFYLDETILDADTSEFVDADTVIEAKMAVFEAWEAKGVRVRIRRAIVVTQSEP